MSKLLLLIIYVAFIGLGLPDSLFGTAWPAIYADFELPISFGSFVTVTIALGTIVSSLLSTRLISKLGTSKVTAISTMLTAVGLLGFALSPNYWCMILLSVPLGIGAGAIDVALNNYVALHYSARQMSFLHCFYGIGVSVSPYVLSLVMHGQSGWRKGYTVAFIIQLSITLLMFLSLPVWKRVKESKENESQIEVKALTIRQALKIPGVKYMCALFFVTCAIECSCSGWGSTFLVEYKQLAPEKAAQIILLYFVGMAVGRFLSGVVATKLHSWTIIKISMGILGVAMVMLLIPGMVVFSAIGLFLVGLGNGPLYPNYNYLTPENFGEDVSQSIIGIQMASAYGGILLGPLFCGLIGQAVGMFIFPLYLVAFFVAMLCVTSLLKKILRNRQ